MLLRCTKSFGNFEPGDEVEAPDGAVFDTFHFEKAPAVDEKASDVKAKKGIS